MLLVTGITGHSGRHFLELWDARGTDRSLRCLVRDSSDMCFLPEAAQNLGVEVLRGDLGDPEFLGMAMQGVDTVLHIAGIQRSPHVYRAAVDAGVRWLVLVHTTGRYSKYREAAEEYVTTEDAILARSDDIDVTVLRPTMIYGSSRDRNMHQLIGYLDRHRIFPVFGGGQNLMQPVLARDLASAYFGVLTHPGTAKNREYDLSGGTALPYMDILRTIARELGRRVCFVHLPVGLSAALVRLYNGIAPNPRIGVEQVLRMNEDKAYSHEAATRDFGYAPASFEDGIRAEVAEYLAAKVASVRDAHGEPL